MSSSIPVLKIICRLISLCSIQCPVQWLHKLWVGSQSCCQLRVASLETLSVNNVCVSVIKLPLKKLLWRYWRDFCLDHLFLQCLYLAFFCFFTQTIKIWGPAAVGNLQVFLWTLNAQYYTVVVIIVSISFFVWRGKVVFLLSYSFVCTSKISYIRKICNTFSQNTANQHWVAV